MNAYPTWKRLRPTAELARRYIEWLVQQNMRPVVKLSAWTQMGLRKTSQPAFIMGRMAYMHKSFRRFLRDMFKR